MVLLTACSRPAPEDKAIIDNTSSTHDDLYNQRRTEACWIYAMLACIEHEQLRKGDSVTLSRQWLMSNLMREQTLERFIINKQQSPNSPLSSYCKGLGIDTKSSGKNTEDPETGTEYLGINTECSGRGSISMRGVGPDALRLISEYGLIPYSMERSRINNSHVLERKLCHLASLPSTTLSNINDKITELLPRFTISKSPLPPTGGAGGGSSLGGVGGGFRAAGSGFYFFSMRYTPLQFAESIMYNQQWRFYASVEYHPWHTMFPLEDPDNRRYHKYMNLPMPELLRMVKASLRSGHAVYWEYGKPSQQQQGGGATSSHAMAIVGIRNGKFLCLNSYGTEWGNNGYCLISEDYFIRHTCNVGIIHNA